MNPEDIPEQIRLDGSTDIGLKTPVVSRNRECYQHFTLLTDDEERDSKLVGELPRCRQCLVKVGLSS